MNNGYFTKSERKESVTTLDIQAAKDFKRAVTAAKNRRDMFWRSQAPELASMLTQALEQLKKAVRDPQVVVEALVGFYKRDAEIFERCDDSYGNVGDVFRITAAEMFANYASQCSDKEKIADQVLVLQEDSNYGVRDILIDNLSSFLDKRNSVNLVKATQDFLLRLRSTPDDRQLDYLVKTFMRIIFKSIHIQNQEIVKFELNEPWKTCYEEAMKMDSRFRGNDKVINRHSEPHSLRSVQAPAKNLNEEILRPLRGLRMTGSERRPQDDSEGEDIKWLKTSEKTTIQAIP